VFVVQQNEGRARSDRKAVRPVKRRAGGGSKRRGCTRPRAPLYVKVEVGASAERHMHTFIPLKLSVKFGLKQTQKGLSPKAPLGRISSSG
jgi:hypothetical protein